MMALSSYVGYLHKCGAAELPINGKLVILGVRVHVLVIKARGTADRFLVRPVDGIVGIFGGNIERRRRGRKSLALVKSGTPVNEGVGKLRRHGTAVIEAKGSVANLIVISPTFKGGIELPPTGADAAVSRSTSQLGQEAFVDAWGIGDADTRRKIIVA